MRLLVSSIKVVFRKTLNQRLVSKMAAFQAVTDRVEIKKILKQRLPFSALLCNMLKYEEICSSDLFKFEWFTVKPVGSQEVWVATKFHREENWREYLICPPSQGPFQESELESLKLAMKSSPEVFRFRETFIFTGIYPSLVDTIKQVVFDVLGVPARNDPCYQFYMPVEQAAKITVPNLDDDSIRMKQLDIPAGAELIAKNWPYAAPGSYDHCVMQIKHLPSSGIYADDVPVCGVISKRHGALGMLFTEPSYRNRGYGTAVLKNVMQQWGNLGLIPCSHVDEQNVVSKKFHEKLGFVKSHEGHFVVT